MMLSNIIEICVAIDIAILGIAYPIIVNKISGIGDKYKSQYIPVVFDSEFPQRKLEALSQFVRLNISIFTFTLYGALFSLLFLIFQFSPILGWDYWLINNSANLIVFTLTMILTAFFFIWLNKVALFSGQSVSLLKHLISKYDSSANENMRPYYLKAINELTYYAIEKQDEHLQKTLLEFYYKVFSDIRRAHNKSQPIAYPIDLYFLVKKVNQESANSENNKLQAIEHRAVSGVWLLGEGQEDIQISKETYDCLWQNIYIICDHPRLIKLFWAHSSQYFIYRLKMPGISFDFESNTITNRAERDKRQSERREFLEFHYALGGLMLYRKQFTVLKYMFEYSQSQPPDHPLLPETMTEIFRWFENFYNESTFGGVPVDLKYYFPELDNLGNNTQIRYWICSYIAILFVRQYSLHQYYTYQNFTASPNLPDDTIELGNWLDSLPFLEKCLNNVLLNEDLLKELGFLKLKHEKENDIKNFVETTRKKIKGKIGQQKLNSKLSKEKIRSFFGKSNKILSEAFETYTPIFTPVESEHSDSDLQILLSGSITMMPKSAFVMNDTTMGFDSVFASEIASEKIKRTIPHSFKAARTKRYLFNKDNIKTALSRIIGNRNDIVIIGLNVSAEMHEILKRISFHKSMIYIPSAERRFQDELFVLKQTDLPAIEHNDLDEETKKEYELEEINKELKIYASVIDMSNQINDSVKEGMNKSIDLNGNELQVRVAISFLSIIYWKNKRNVIEIDIASEYKELGIQNDVDEIEPL